MKPIEQQIAIAEACGYKNIHIHSNLEVDVFNGMLVGIFGSKDYECTIPDYLNDLNAMHEAEKVLTFDEHKDCQFHQYWNYLSGIGPSGNVGRRILLCATTSQRAEAFLRTIGKWKD